MTLRSRPGSRSVGQRNREAQDLASARRARAKDGHELEVDCCRPREGGIRWLLVVLSGDRRWAAASVVVAVACSCG